MNHFDEWRMHRASITMTIHNSGLFLATPNESSKNKNDQILDEDDLKGKKIRIISTTKADQVDEEKGRSEEEEEESSNEQTKLSNCSETKSTNNPIKHLIQDLVIFSNPYYYLILLVEIVFFFCFLSFMIIMQNLPVDHGIEKTKAASLSSFFAIGKWPFGDLLVHRTLVICAFNERISMSISGCEN